MTGQPDSVNRLRQPPANFEIHYRQRDGDTGARRQHLIQAAIARVIIIFRVTCESQFTEEVPVRGFHVIGAAQPAS